MRRRRLLLAAAAAAALPRLVVAQSRPARIGWVTAQRPPRLVPYVAALAELGFAEGATSRSTFATATTISARSAATPKS
jgi:hypothetical protein